MNETTKLYNKKRCTTKRQQSMYYADNASTGYFSVLFLFFTKMTHKTAKMLSNHKSGHLLPRPKKGSI